MPKVSKGLATWAGIVAAVGQYAAAVAVFLEADNQSDALGPLVTATATLLAVIVGRMQQAKALAARPAAPASWSKHLSDAVSGQIGGTLGVGTASAGTGTTYVQPWPVPGVGLRSVPGEFDREPQPRAVPNAEQRELPDCA